MKIFNSELFNRTKYVSYVNAYLIAEFHHVESDFESSILFEINKKIESALLLEWLGY